MPPLGRERVLRPRQAHRVKRPGLLERRDLPFDLGDRRRPRRVRQRRRDQIGASEHPSRSERCSMAQATASVAGVFPCVAPATSVASNPGAAFTFPSGTAPSTLAAGSVSRAAATAGAREGVVSRSLSRSGIASPPVFDAASTTSALASNPRSAACLRIPMKAATDSDGKRPPVPIQNGHFGRGSNWAS